MKKFITLIFVLGMMLACSMSVHAEPSPSGKPTYDKNPNISQSNPNGDEHSEDTEDSQSNETVGEQNAPVSQTDKTASEQNKPASQPDKTTSGKKPKDKATSKTNEKNVTNDTNESILRPVQETISPETGKSNRAFYEFGIAAAFFAFSAAIVKRYRLVEK